MKRTDILAVIHARGGSKRIPLKNLVHLHGKPLLAYPILTAKASRFITRVVVSTDHAGITEEAKKWGAEVPFCRPADISEDVPSELVTLHALEYLQFKENYKPSIVVTMTPATPFTSVEKIDEGIALLEKQANWDSVVTVRKASEHPEWMMWRENEEETFQTVLGNPLNGKYNVSQNLRPAYYPLGAFFINRTDRFLQTRCLYGSTYGAIVLDATHNIDIDTIQDLTAAETMNVFS